MEEGNIFKSKGFIYGRMIGLIIVASFYGFQYGNWITNKEQPTNINAQNPIKISTTLSDNFAVCLKNKGFVYYGSYTCPACTYQNDLFGDSKKYLNYVECGDIHDGDPWYKICVDKEIHATPTWFFPDGKKREGVLSLETLEKESGCSLKGFKQ